MKIKRKNPEIIEAITFDELIEYGRQAGANIVNGMPWSFHYKGRPVSHERDDLYIVGDQHFHRGEVLVSEGGKKLDIISREEFEEAYEII